MSFQTDKTTRSDHESSGRDSFSEEEDDPDEEASPTYHQGNEDVETSLNSFRIKWQKELQISPDKIAKQENGASHQECDYESQARALFNKGVELEHSGQLYEAIQFYRRAVQMVPDIEFRLDAISKINKPAMRERLLSEQNNDDDQDEDEDSDDEINPDELLPRIQKKLSKVSAICIPNSQQLMTTHISALPMEMLLYILRWVVSSDLDMRGLEMFSMVCRGFYLCARDPEIWRLACMRVWGLNCAGTPLNYPSWRDMFINRSRLQFNGCYIGKTTYIRHGENSFQDQFYRPWHLVAYYRYLRFFPEGVVLVLTSSDEPAQCVGQMKYRSARDPILKGYYRLKDDKVMLVVERQDNTNINKKINKRRGLPGEGLYETAEQTLHMELQIKSTNKKRHVQLVWTHYSVFTRNTKGDESTCTFDLVANRFPPLWFSRVKSFSSESENPLQ